MRLRPLIPKKAPDPIDAYSLRPSRDQIKFWEASDNISWKLT